MDIPETPAETRPPLELPPMDLGGRTSGPSTVRVHVTGFRFEGNTLFSDAELEKIVTPYIGREIDFEDLEAARLALTQHYVNQGYVNSGAIIPDQEVQGGVITLRLVEGKLSEISVQDNRNLLPSYIRERIELGAGPPLNVYALRDRLYILQQDPHIARIDASLAPGMRPGEARLNVNVDEAPRRHLYVAFNNYRSPSVGEGHGEVDYVDNNLLGHGDTIDLRAGHTIGVDDADVNYSLPLNAYDGYLSLRYARSEATVVESPFDALDVKSRAETFAFGVMSPYFRTPRRNYSVGFFLERRRSENYLLGEPFAFSPGTTDNGKTRLGVMRLVHSWLAQESEYLVAGRSTFSLGTSAFDATIGDQEPDANFFAWLGQLQWVTRNPAQGTELVWRTDAQLADDSLPALEQFALGGRYSVRGYRENQLVRDNGVFASLEYRVPLRKGKHGVRLAAFGDWGRSWQHTGATPHPLSIHSVGLGLLGSYGTYMEYEVYAAKPLRDVNDHGKSLQDEGIHAQLRWRVF